jgi:hypothetical protein
MNQKEFTEYTIPKIIARLPFLEDFCTFKPNDIIDIAYKSKKGKLTIWLTTQNAEITIGFAGDTECDWHTHMSQFGANTPDEGIQAAIKILDSIINNKERIIHSTASGYFITDNVDDVTKDPQACEIIETFYWSEL